MRNRAQIRTLTEGLEFYEFQVAADFSASTWRGHKGRLQDFSRWVGAEFGENTYLTDIDQTDMVRYFKRLRPPTYAAASYNNYRQYLNAFWTYATRSGWVTSNPMLDVKAMKPDRRIRLQLSAEELLAALDGASPRDRVALAIGMNTALRAFDIVSLTVGQVNLIDNLLVAWVEKQDVEREFAITTELRAELLRWMRHYALETGWTLETLPNNYRLVPAAHNSALGHDFSAGSRTVYKPLGERAMSNPEKIVHRALARLGHPTQGEGFHTMRRSALRALYDLAKDDGIPDPIRVPQTLAGHASRRTTEIYLGVTHEQQLTDEMLRGRSFLGRAAEAARDRNDALDQGDADRGELSA